MCGLVTRSINYNGLLRAFNGQPTLHDSAALDLRMSSGLTFGSDFIESSHRGRMVGDWVHEEVIFEDFILHLNNVLRISHIILISYIIFSYVFILYLVIIKTIIIYYLINNYYNIQAPTMFLSPERMLTIGISEATLNSVARVLHDDGFLTTVIPGSEFKVRMVVTIKYKFY